MSDHKLTDWLPTTRKEAKLRGWDEIDVVLFSGDAYVDHPSFGAAVIGRILEAEGLREREEDLSPSASPPAASATCCLPSTPPDILPERISLR